MLTDIDDWREKPRWCYEHRRGSVCLEVQRRAFGGKLDVRSGSSGDVVAGRSALARLAGAGGEPLAVALAAFDGVACTRLLVRHRVGAEATNADERLDGARFRDRVLKCGG